jgi:uncharacterized SAM-binding protein YcdF (DUF218 family)
LHFRRKFLWIALLVVVLLLVVSHPLWLRGLGHFLIKSDGPARAEAAVVLAGDPSGDRIRTAVRLLREGFVPLIIVSGPCCVYGKNEGDLAVELAVREGANPEWFAVVPMIAHSTREEAVYVINFLRNRGISDFLLVTSDHHTRRAGSVYREATDDLRFRVVAAPDRKFQADRWWFSREGQKVFLMQWERTIGSWLGL